MSQQEIYNMEKYVGQAIKGLRLFLVTTSAMIYFPFYLLVKDQYLVLGRSEFVGDLILFITSIVLAIISLYIWYRIYKQFKKDRTRLGFAEDKNGVMLMIQLLIEAGIVIAIIHFTSSGLFN